MQIVSAGRTLHERISTTLEIDGASVAVYVIFRWRELIGRWMMGVQDANGKDVITNIPLLSGVEPRSANLIRIFQHLGLGSMYVLPISDELAGINPNDKTLESEYAVLWGDSV